MAKDENENKPKSMTEAMFAKLQVIGFGDKNEEIKRALQEG